MYIILLIIMLTAFVVNYAIDRERYPVISLILGIVSIVLLAITTVHDFHVVDYVAIVLDIIIGTVMGYQLAAAIDCCIANRKKNKRE